MLDHVLRLHDQGWRGLLPILPPGAEPATWLAEDKAEELRKAGGKGPGRYIAKEGRWGGLGDWRAYPDDEATLRAWASWPGVNVGLRANHDGSGVHFLDADILNPAAAGQIASLIRREIGLDAPVRFGRQPKALFPIRVRGTLRKLRSTVVLIDGQRSMLEVLAEGQQAVIAGVHPGTGKPYRWPLGGLEDIGPEDLPELTATKVGEIVTAASAILLRYGPAVGRNRSRLLRDGDATPRSIEELRARNEALALDATAFVRNTDWARDDWVSWCYSLRGAFGEKGKKLWLDFTAESTKHTSPATARKVWNDATQAEKAGQLRSGAGAILAIARDEGWTPPLRVVEGPPPHYPAEELEPAEAAERLRSTVARAINKALAWRSETGDAPQTGIKAPAGLGKTVTVLEELAKCSALPRFGDFNPKQQPEVWYYVPTIRLAEELAQKARALGLAVQVVRGREAVVEGEPLCAKHEEARIIARAGHPVMGMLCRKKMKDGTQQRCEFHDQCRYLKQFDATGPALRIFAHDYLTLPRPSGLPTPDLIVIDEAFALRTARHTSFGVDRLTAPRTGMKLEHEAEIQDVAGRARDRLEKGEDPRGAADADTFARLADLEAGLDDEDFVWPSMKWQEQQRRLANLRKSEQFKLAAMWRVLRQEEGRTGPLYRVELRRNEQAPGGTGELQDRVHVWWRAALRLPNAPVLVLDASLDERIARKLLPRLEVETIAARRNAEVVQVVDTACSRNRLLSFPSADEQEQARAINRLADVRHLAEVEAVGGSTLLVTYKPAAERLGEIADVDVAHFGALRGLDRYKDHDTIIIAGRQQPPPLEVEALARALFGDDDEPLQLTGGLREQTRGYRMRDGRSRGVTVAVHADPRCQAILEQIRERETEQAIDRLRLVHRDRPARVIVLSSLPVDLTIDRLVTWRELMPDRLTVAAARLGGVLPLAPTWLAGRFPDLWATAKAAKHEVERAGNWPQNPNGESYLGNGANCLATYRVAGRAGRLPSRALIAADHEAPEAALAALVGPLALFRWEGEPPRAEPSTRVEEPALVEPPAVICARCADPAEPGHALCETCAWLVSPAAMPGFAPRPSPERRLAGGRS